jgi:Ethylene-responsive protein kinase Le-CTR1
MKLLTSPHRRFLALIILLLVFPPALRARTLVEPGSGDKTDLTPPGNENAVSARFRREFTATALQPNERLVILVAAADGEVVYLNGREIGRSNMPAGPVDEKTLALAKLDERHAGLFVRFPAPPAAVRSGEKNLIEVDLHSAKAGGSRLSFDLAVKTLPADQPATPPEGLARQVLETFRKTSYIAPGTPIPDGYFDGGRHMTLDAEDRATSGREILLVDRAHDPELAKDLEFARSLRGLSAMDRARKLSEYVDTVLTPLGGRQLLAAAMDELQSEFLNKPLRIGDVRDQFHAGVCRHRSLLFKVLADEAGLKTALVRGNYVHLHAGGSGAHAWNEVQLDDGRRYLVDTTLHPKSEFPEITSPSVTSLEVARRYVRPDGTPYYQAIAK